MLSRLSGSIIMAKSNQETNPMMLKKVPMAINIKNAKVKLESEALE